MNNCKYDTCHRPSKYGCIGYCWSHYKRYKENDIDRPIKPINQKCQVEGCENKHFAKCWCSMHYERVKKHGDPHKVVRQKGVDGKFLDKNGYVYLAASHPKNKYDKAKYEHRIVMEEFLGRELHDKETVHHKDGNRQNNNIENLELWSTRQPKGQRIEDKMKWVYEMLDLYEKEYPKTPLGPLDT